MGDDRREALTHRGALTSSDEERIDAVLGAAESRGYLMLLVALILFVFALLWLQARARGGRFLPPLTP